MDLVFERCLALDLDFPILDSPIWLFGKSFSIHYGKDNGAKDLDELRRTVGSCIWLTYRKNFPPIQPTSMTSDRGWGCMVRAGQMMIAKALLRRHLGPHWYWEHSLRTRTYLQILSLFEDTPKALFSLHEITRSGVALGKPVGTWLGPNTVAQALKRILNTTTANPVDLEMVIAMDSSLIKSEVKRACLKTQIRKDVKNENGELSSLIPVPAFNTPRESGRWKPLVLVIPLRLGLSQLNPEYVPAFRSVFEVKQNIGILGGRPNSALYFIGYAEDEVLFLDPHTVQNTVTVGAKIFETEMEADASYHINKPGRMPFSAMDPSLAVCFYCSSEEDFDELCNELSDKWATAPLPLFEICEDRPDWNPALTSSRSAPGESWTKVDMGNSSIQNPPSSRPPSSPSLTNPHEDDFEILG